MANSFILLLSINIMIMTVTLQEIIKTLTGQINAKDKKIAEVPNSSVR